jgi:hypothetical protein
MNDLHLVLQAWRELVVENHRLKEELHALRNACKLDSEKGEIDLRKRSSYRPRGVIPDPLSFVLTGVQRVAQAKHGTEVRIINHDALNNMRRGNGTRRDMDVLIAALNISEALAVLKEELGGDWRDEIRAAQDALLAVGRRGAETGKFILRGPELTALNLGMEIHDAQLQECTVAELEKAMDYVQSILRHKRARAIVQRKEKDDES